MASPCGMNKRSTDVSRRCTDRKLTTVIDVNDPWYYAQYPIQPIDFIVENKLGYLEGNIIKYICRYTCKNGLDDLKKARVYLNRLIKEWEHQEYPTERLHECEN